MQPASVLEKPVSEFSVLGELRPMDDGAPILLDKPSLTFGYDRSCDVVLEHPSISPRHCILEFRDGRWFIEDLSGAGVSVNGQTVESAWVPSWSVINIGALEFDLQYSAEDQASPHNGTMSQTMRSKLDHVLKSAQSFKSRRRQVRVDEPPPDDLPKSRFGVLKPSHGQFVIPLLYDELYLGRDPDCDLILPFLAVSKFHCTLRFEGERWFVRDLNQNGITINGQTTESGWLLPGATLGIGGHLFVVDYVTTASAPPADSPVSSEADESEEHPRPENDPDVVEVDEPAVVDSDDDHVLGDVQPVTMTSARSRITEGTQQDSPKPSPLPASVSPAGQGLPPVYDEPLLEIDQMLLSVEQPPMVVREPQAVSLKSAAASPKSTHEKPDRQPPSQRSDPPAAPEALEPPKERQQPPARKIPKPAQHPNVLQPLTSASSPPVELLQTRREQLVQLLTEQQLDGLLLTRPENVAWYTVGAEPPIGSSGIPTVALRVTSESTAILARRSDVEVLMGPGCDLLGLQFSECEWPERSSDVLKDWQSDGRVASDGVIGSDLDVSANIATMRLNFSDFEIEQLRKLGIRVARTIEKAAKEFVRGTTEAQIAGDVASRLVRHEVVPIRIQVWGDGRGQHCPNWKFRRDPVENFCTISVIARRHGLHMATSRTVSFGTPPKELRWTHSDMLVTHVTAMHAAHHQVEAAAVVAQVEQSCMNLGFAPDWGATGPGCITGYIPSEAPITSHCKLKLKSGMPYLWQSSLGPARAVDTFLVQRENSKLLTQTGEWPQVSMTIHGKTYFGQAILQRSSAD